MNLFKKAVQFLYPPRCVFCMEVLDISLRDGLVCGDCSKNIKFLDGLRCFKCGAKIEKGNICISCERANHVFDEGASVFAYEDLKRGISGFKIEGVKTYGVVLGKYMAEFLRINNYSWIKSVDFMTGVPLYIKKKKMRGFDQVDILCKTLSEESGISYNKGVLKRVRMTISQSSLTEAERKENLKGVFEAKNCEGKTVLLIDDIFTTGSTLNECSKSLYRAGAKKVIIFCLSLT